MKVLIVEDEDDIRLLLSRHFHQKKWEVEQAANVITALAQIEKLEDDVLITLDLNLPDGSGFLILETLRDKKKKNPVLILSAYSSMKNEAIRRGASGFLAKPIKFDKLDELILQTIANNN